MSWRTTCEGVRSWAEQRRSNASFLAGSISSVRRAVFSSMLRDMLMRCALTAYLTRMPCACARSALFALRQETAPAALAQRPMQQALERSQRRRLRLAQVFDVEEEGLLEHVLPAHRRVQDLVAVDDPGRSRREVDPRLRAAALEAQVGLGAVVELEHDVVVLGAAPLRDAGLVHQPGAAGERPADRAEVAPRVRLERLADAPAARRAVRVDVGEDAQEPRALHRIGGKGVDVQARVVLAPTA